MDINLTVLARFSARHQVAGDPICGTGDGHSFRVGVRAARVTDVLQFSTVVRALIAELDHEDLNAMLPGVITTPAGIALYIRERLILDWQVTRVTVEMDDLVAEVDSSR